MINPQPVDGVTTPYKPGQGVKTSPPVVLPQEQPARQPRQPKKRGRIARVFGVLFVTLILGFVGFAVAMYANFKSSITVANTDIEGSARSSTVLNFKEGDDASKFDTGAFKQFGDGRFNILLLGIDKAAGLTDSIQVMSIDTITKKANITSLPRDLYVTIPGQGRNKINSVYRFGENDKQGNGPTLAKQVVGNVLGIQITHFALIDFSGLEKLVDALGGIEVTVTEAINDPFFPADTGDGYAPFTIRAGKQTLNGRTALRYARSRKTTSDFDRSRRQQIVIDAIRSKALSAGVISNPVKLTSITTALGKSFKTDLDVSALRTLATIYQDIPDSAKSSGVLDTSSELDLLTSSDNTAAGYIAFPKLGMDVYDDVQAWYAKSIPDPLLSQESPSITLYPGSKTTARQLATYAERLTAYGYTIVISETPQNASTSQLYSHTSKKPFSKNYLERLSGITANASNPFKATTDYSLVYVPKATPTASPTVRPAIRVSPKPSATATSTPNAQESPVTAR